KLWKESEPIIDFSTDGHWLWFDISGNAKTYLFCLTLLVIATVLAKNVIRTRTGRALQAIRDRDVAAEVIGIPEFKYKLIAFSGSSAFAGVAGGPVALFAGMRWCGRCAVLLVRRQAPAGDLGSHPVGRVHRDLAHRRCRHHRRRPRGHAPRRAVTAPRSGPLGLDGRSSRRWQPVLRDLGPVHQHR